MYRIDSGFFRPHTPLSTLSILGLSNVPTTPNGDCAFEAIKIHYDEYTIAHLRCITADYLSDYSNEFLPFFVSDPDLDARDEQQYENWVYSVRNLQEQENDEHWADHLPLVALAKALDINIVIIDMHGCLNSELNELANDIVFILFDKQTEHYEGIQVNRGKNPQLILNQLRTTHEDSYSTHTTSEASSSPP